MSLSENKVCVILARFVVILLCCDLGKNLAVILNSAFHSEI